MLGTVFFFIYHPAIPNKAIIVVCGEHKQFSVE